MKTINIGQTLAIITAAKDPKSMKTLNIMQQRNSYS